MEDAELSLVHSGAMHDAPYTTLGFSPRLLQFPLELRPPRGFAADRLETWPRVEGRLEFVDGRLLYMPPCGDAQCSSVAQATTELVLWSRGVKGFVIGSNEVGITVAGDTRGADAAVWRREDWPAPLTSGYLRTPPLLAVEVTGKCESAADLRTKARWYLNHGTKVVWIIDARARVVLVLTPTSERRLTERRRIPAHPALPGLTPRVKDLLPDLEPKH